MRHTWKLSTILLLIFYAALFQQIPAQSDRNVLIVSDENPAAPAKHGLSKLVSRLQIRGASVSSSHRLEQRPQGTVIVAGLSNTRGPAAQLIRELKIAPPMEPESLLIQKVRWKNSDVLLATGADARGLMYALQEIADRIGWASNAESLLSEVKDAREKPFVAERGLSIYTMQKAHFEERFFKEVYWADYLDMLARNRFNTFVLIFGYENAGYFAPAYPYFFDVEGFPGVRVRGLTPEQQQRNLNTLNQVIRMAHDRGLDFTVGLWDHIYRGGVQSGGIRQDLSQPIPYIVTGLDEKNLAAYHRTALAKFFKLVPEVNTVQFRMHGESGLKKEEMRSFWQDMYQVMKDHAPHVRFDARVKDFPDSLIDLALEMGVNIRLNTKYWAEQMGLPFHPTHINRPNQNDRRHGYADLLRYPQRYKMHWQLWSGGTTRVLLWGDPDYARRFVESTQIYPSDGFEVNEPLATKMASHPHEMKPFGLLNARYRYYDWEFERYWHFYQVFGRMGYNPQTPAEVWRREFERRFGKEAAPDIERALHLASQVLPRAQAYNFPYNRFPTTRGWVEKQRREDLPAYAAAEPSDTEQFLGIENAARHMIEGKESAKIWPQQTSAWFAATSEEILKLVDNAEAKIGNMRNKEFTSTSTDLRILANLALYHSRRIHAGLSWSLYKLTKASREMENAIGHESRAVEAWARLVEAAGDTYNDDLMMGLPASSLSGHWRDELVELKKGLEQLRQLKPSDTANLHATVNSGVLSASAANSGNHGRSALSRASSSSDKMAPVVIHTPVKSASPNQRLTISAQARDSSGIKWMRVLYRSVNQYQDYKTVEMRPAGAAGSYQALIPGEDVVPRWDLMYFIEVMDHRGNGKIYPDLEKETPYVLVRLKR